MEIAALPISISQINQASNPAIGTAILSKCLDSAEASGQNLIRMMEQSVTPELGNIIDLKI